MIAEDLRTTLGPLCGGRFYAHVAPENAATPYGTYQLVSGVPVSSLDGESSLVNYRYQVDLFGPDKGVIDALAASVRAAMDAAVLFKSVCQLQQDLFEDAVQLYRVSLDFSIWP